MGALGAALFARDAWRAGEAEAHVAQEA